MSSKPNVNDIYIIVGNILYGSEIFNIVHSLKKKLHIIANKNVSLSIDEIILAMVADEFIFWENIRIDVNSDDDKLTKAEKKFDISHIIGNEMYSTINKQSRVITH